MAVAHIEIFVSLSTDDDIFDEEELVSEIFDSHSSSVDDVLCRAEMALQEALDKVAARAKAVVA